MATTYLAPATTTTQTEALEAESVSSDGRLTKKLT